MTTNPQVPTYIQGTVVIKGYENVPVSGSVSVTGTVTAKVPLEEAYKADGTAMTVKYSHGSVNSVGDNTVISAVANKRIVVLQATYWVTNAETMKWRTDSTDITSAMSLVADEKIVEPYCPHGLFRTAVGEALKVNLTTGVSFRWHITYVEY